MSFTKTVSIYPGYGLLSETDREQLRKWMNEQLGFEMMAATCPVTQIKEEEMEDVKIFEVRTRCGEDLCIFAHNYEETDVGDIWFTFEEAQDNRKIIGIFPRGSWTYVIDKGLHSEVRDVYSAQQAKEREKEKKAPPDIQKSAEELLGFIKDYTREKNGRC